MEAQGFCGLKRLLFELMVLFKLRRETEVVIFRILKVQPENKATPPDLRG